MSLIIADLLMWYWTILKLYDVYRQLLTCFLQR